MKLPTLLIAAAGVAMAAFIVGTRLDLSSEESETGTSELPVITFPRVMEAWPDALVSGRLTLKADCLLLHDNVVIWPLETKWDETSRAVISATGQVAAVGEQFTGGGGLAGADLETLSEEGRAAVNDCLDRTGAGGVTVAAFGQ